MPDARLVVDPLERHFFSARGLVGRLGRLSDWAEAKILGWVGIFLIALASAVVFYFDPRQPHYFFPGCVFHRLTGLFCPGCGATRALHDLVHGDIVGAWAMNPFFVIVVAAGLFLGFDRWTGRRAALAGARKFILDGRGWAVFVIAFMVARNLPWLPFSLLAPG